MTRAAMIDELTELGYLFHANNYSDTAPDDETAMYYLPTDELTGIYEQLTSE